MAEKVFLLLNESARKGRVQLKKMADNVMGYLQKNLDKNKNVTIKCAKLKKSYLRIFVVRKAVFFNEIVPYFCRSLYIKYRVEKLMKCNECEKIILINF